MPRSFERGRGYFDAVSGTEAGDGWVTASHLRLGTPAEFAAYVTTLRTAQKRKRNLMRLMDEHGL